MRIEREGGWIVQQHCLERMLPYFFVAGITIMLVTSAGIYEICSTFHLIPSRNSSMVHTSAVTQKELLWCPWISTESRRISNWENMHPGTEGHIDQPEQVAVWIDSIGVCSHLPIVMDEEGSTMWELDIFDSLRTFDKAADASTPTDSPV